MNEDAKDRRPPEITVHAEPALMSSVGIKRLKRLIMRDVREEVAEHYPWMVDRLATDPAIGSVRNSALFWIDTEVGTLSVVLAMVANRDVDEDGAVVAVVFRTLEAARAYRLYVLRDVFEDHDGAAALETSLAVH
jgi:hypothetical protein